MKIYKKIIASLVLVVVLVSTFVMLAPSASAATVNNTDYKVRLLKTLSFEPVGSQSWEITSYISVSTYDWKLEGDGRFGYDKNLNTYYIQIDKYAGSNGSWLLKLDGSRYWQYRDGLNDYGTIHSTFHSMKDEPKDIFVDIAAYRDHPTQDLTLPTFKNLFEDITGLKGKTINFYRDGLKYKTLTVYSSYSLPTPDPRPGYEFLYYDNRDGIHRNPGETEIYIDDRTVHYYEVWKLTHTDFIFCLDDDFSKIDTCDKIIYKDQDVDADFVIPEFPADKLPEGKSFSHWVYYSEAYGNTFDPGNKMTPLEAEHIFVPVFGDALKYYFYDTMSNDEIVIYISLDDTSLVFPEIFISHDGYIFKGWTDEKSVFYAGREYSISAIDGHDLFSVWEKSDTPSVPGGSGSDSSTNITFTFTGEGVDTYSIDAKAGVSIKLPYGPSREGYTFQGWRIISSGIIFPENTVYSDQVDRTFEAVWKKVREPFDITFDFRETDIASYTVSVDQYGSITLPSVPERVGYRPKWNCCGLGLDPGTKLSYYYLEVILAEEGSNNATFYLLWEESEGMTINFYLGGAVYKTITVYDDYVLPTPTRDGYTFSHYEDNGLNIYHPGDKITYIDGATEHIAEIWDQDDKDITFIAEFYDDWGVFESCYVSVPVGDTLTFPELPDLSKFGLEATRWYSGDYSYYPGDIVSYDDLLDRYGRETTFYVDYNEHIVYPDDPPTIDPDDPPTINPDGTDGDGNNFIVSFFFDTFDRTKELCSPYLTSFEIPFLGITLAEVIEFIFFGLIAWFVIIIISKVIGAIK